MTSLVSVKQHKQVFARTGEKYLEDGAIDPVKVIGIQEHPDKAMEFGLLFLAEKIGTPICLNFYKQIKDLDIKVRFSIQLTYLTCNLDCVESGWDYNNSCYYCIAQDRRN